jgi:two-component system, OmpR family, phosphate regulon response regulator PhoB
MDQEQTVVSSDKKIVLIVEDDAFMGSILERKFEGEPFQLFLATDTDKAREILKANQVSIMLLDIMLPGMDGITFLKELKANPQFMDIPVIITSNLGKPEEIERGLKEGASGYIIKAQVSTSEIVDKVKEVLGVK